MNRQGHSESYLEKNGQFEQSFRTDARRVWQLLLPIFKDHSAYVHFKAILKTKNGHIALRAVTAHYLGDSMMDYHANANAHERELQMMQYLGEQSCPWEQKNFNFDKYSSRMLELHQLLDGLKEHGYSGIDEHAKVRYFMQGLVHSSMDSCKLHFLSNSACRGSFEECARVCRAFIQQDKQGDKKSLHIAAVSSASGKGNELTVSEQQKVMFYDNDVWCKCKQMTLSQRDEVMELRRRSKGRREPQQEEAEESGSGKAEGCSIGKETAAAGTELEGRNQEAQGECESPFR